MAEYLIHPQLSFNSLLGAVAIALMIIGVIMAIEGISGSWPRLIILFCKRYGTGKTMAASIG